MTLTQLFQLAKQALRKRKGKVIFMYLTNPGFRLEINELKKVLVGEAIFRPKTLALSEINISHRIVYHKWVPVLVARLWDGKSLKPIKVQWVNNRYVIVDGHHRFDAYCKVFGSDYRIEVLERVPHDEARIHRNTRRDDQGAGNGGQGVLVRSGTSRSSSW